VRRLVAVNTQGRTFGFLGEPRVDVVELNLDLDRTSTARGADASH
jgi:K+-transporting ATPase ATPase C chain